MEQPGPLERLLSGRVLGIKILSSSLMALGGAVVGREGPSIQISASVFYFIKKQWTKLGNKLVLKNMLIAGGASGLAAAFNTPLGGIIYAVEELAKEHVSNFRIGLLEAVITAGLVAQLLNGPYLFLGFPVIPEIQRKSLLAVLLIAIVCGLVGALFGKILFWGLQWRLRLSLKQSFFFVIGLSLVFSLIVYIVGPLATGSGKNLITGILFNNQESSALYAAARILGSLLSSLAGAAGGIFAPALASGAATGEWLASILAPNMQNLGPICGMVAFLTGVTRTPVTAFVLILEMTDRHSAIFPMMLAALVAHIFARAVDPKSFYENMSEHLVQQESQNLFSLKQS
jgi:H+/Cl- antiporter ClcA